MIQNLVFCRCWISCCFHEHAGGSQVPKPINLLALWRTGCQLRNCSLDSVFFAAIVHNDESKHLRPVPVGGLDLAPRCVF